MTTQCLGRLTLDKKNIPDSKFENSKYGFFLPRRCGAQATNDRLCASCKVKQEKIASLLEKWGGSMQNQADQLHGLLVEPIPPWSRIYQGAYFQKMLDKGLHVDSGTLKTADAAVAEAYKGLEEYKPEMPPKKKPEEATAPVKKPVIRRKKAVEAPQVPEPVPPPIKEEVPPPKKKGGRTKKPVAPSEPSPTILETLNTLKDEPATPPVTVVPLSTSPPTPPKKQPKQVARKKPIATTAPQPTPIGLVSSTPIDASTLQVVKVQVRKTEIDGRTVYVEGSKDKVYDLKFKYLGRWNRSDDTIVGGYPDSDSEAS